MKRSKYLLLHSQFKGSTVLLKGHTSGSDSEPRTQRGPRSPNKGKPDTTVKLDADVKEQLVSGDWQIPTFTSVNVCAETTNFQEKKEKTNVGTFTHPKDFSNIQRILNEKLKLTEEDGFIKMMDTRPRIISDGTSPLERPNTQVKYDVCGFLCIKAKAKMIFLKSLSLLNVNTQWHLLWTQLERCHFRFRPIKKNLNDDANFHLLQMLFESLETS